MEPIDVRTKSVIELVDWLRAKDMIAHRWMDMMKMLRYDEEAVVEVAERLFEDGWEDTTESLVLAARLLGGNSGN
jgi:hypothetical protein